MVATETGKVSPDKVEKSIEDNCISTKLAEHIFDSLQTVNFTKDERDVKFRFVTLMLITNFFLRFTTFSVFMFI